MTRFIMLFCFRRRKCILQIPPRMNENHLLLVWREWDFRFRITKLEDLTSSLGLWTAVPEDSFARGRGERAEHVRQTRCAGIAPRGTVASTRPTGQQNRKLESALNSNLSRSQEGKHPRLSEQGKRINLLWFVFLKNSQTLAKGYANFSFRKSIIIDLLRSSFQVPKRIKESGRKYHRFGFRLSERSFSIYFRRTWKSSRL